MALLTLKVSIVYRKKTYLQEFPLYSIMIDNSDVILVSPNRGYVFIEKQREVLDSVGVTQVGAI